MPPRLPHTPELPAIMPSSPFGAVGGVLRRQAAVARLALADNGAGLSGHAA